MSYDPGMGHAHAIALGAHGYAVATDPARRGCCGRPVTRRQ